MVYRLGSRSCFTLKDLLKISCFSNSACLCVCVCVCVCVCLSVFLYLPVLLLCVFSLSALCHFCSTPIRDTILAERIFQHVNIEGMLLLYLSSYGKKHSMPIMPNDTPLFCEQFSAQESGILIVMHCVPFSPRLCSFIYPFFQKVSNVVSRHARGFVNAS